MKTLNIRLLLLTFVTLLSTSLQGCGGSSDYLSKVNNTENYEVLALAGMDDNLSTFATLAEMSGIDWKVEFAEPVTLFIPTNKAFEQMPVEEYRALLDPNNRVQLTRFLKRHILPSRVPAAEFNTTQAIETAGEEEIPVSTSLSGSVISVGGAQLIESDIFASNGIIHVVNSVIQPSRDVFVE